MFSQMLSFLLRMLWLILAVLGQRVMYLIDAIIRNAYNGLFNAILAGRSRAYLSYSVGLEHSILIIAYTFCFVICIYGFLIENLDFHTYDGWDRVIRLLIRIVIVTVMLTWSTSILNTGIETITKANTFIASLPSAEFVRSDYDGYIKGPFTSGNLLYLWPGLRNSEGAGSPVGVNFDFYNDIVWDEDAFNYSGNDIAYYFADDYPATPRNVALPSFVTALPSVSLGIFNMQAFGDVLWCTVTSMIGMIVMIILSVMILKKVFKMGINVLIPIIEFKVLAVFFPIGLSFYASHSTQHVGQGYIRWLIKTGLQTTFKILVLIASGTVCSLFIMHHFDLQTLLGGAGGQAMQFFREITCGHASDVIILFNTLICLSVMEMALDKSEHLAGKIFGN